MENEQLLNLAKKTYEEKNYEESLTYAITLLDKKLANDYLYQIASAMFFLKKEYRQALHLTNEGYKLYKSKLYLTNKVKILQKLSEDNKNYAEKLIDFLRQLMDMDEDSINTDIDIINAYIGVEDPFIFSQKIINLYKQDKIDTKLLSKICYIILYKYTLSNEAILPLVKTLLEKDIGISIDNDQVLIDNLKKLSDPSYNMLAIYYLTCPDILYDNNTGINKNYQQTISNLKKLIVHFDKPVFDTIDTFYDKFRAYYYYYYVYYGFNNAELYKLVSTLLKKLCPDITYTSVELKPQNRDKIKIAFISSLLTINHSVCKDRIGIIKSLVLDDRFDVCIISNTDKEEEIYKELTNGCKINKIILPESIKESRNIIGSHNFNIIVYPEIGMNSVFYLLSHARLAPVQINTWGHSETSGIDTIDYYFSSKYYETPDMSSNYSEKLVLLDSLCTYYYSIDMFEFCKKIIHKKNKILLEFNLPSNCNLYGSLQPVFKYHPDNIRSIKNILYNDPKAIILFINYKGLEKKFYNYLEKHLGYHMNRVRVFDRLNQESYCKVVSIVDILLDSYPFGGCNTSLDAFYFNKIVITLPSSKLNGRFTYGFYQKMGITEPISNDIEDYSSKAIYYMNNIDERQKIEELIKQNKHKLFEEIDSITTWKNKLIELSENKNKKNKNDKNRKK